ncbi:family 43 glycosylhydrolase [Mucilaginibacter sp. cycad4]|uniref:family 43 glycosylhydrolase n=1 Tax=Mucilaginibacter sp. cycad4 TaxID=3342096 RepID=UPI002AAA712E|nr:family 43 glycosylhydrolase [Mucilaginibacter gossypii]WPV02003.1 family 43 glycosylhydrolase [Mucilaginibacter gossypii]
MKRCKILLIALAVSFSITAADAQSNAKQTIICNPLNLSYRFQLDKPSRREAADPVIILFKGKYYLFASKSGGYWSSNDLIDWKFITSNDLPWEDYAPTALVMNDAVYFMALDKRIYKSIDPSTGRWEIAKEGFSIKAEDPDLFLDDDGKLYLYYGLSPSKPISGVQLDKTTFNPIGEPVACLNTKSSDYGWERTGEYNSDKGWTWLEGAWMMKHNGKYYLQYATPATQFKSYNDGIYVADSPLGPFELANNNPFSYKPEGFIAGAGHGCTFKDKYGNFWSVMTMTISVKEHFERRLGLFPAFMGKDGEFYTYTGFGDFPHVIPQRRMGGENDYQPAWMLLSHNKPVQVSSALENHQKENITGENIRKYWSAATGEKGEWAIIDLQHPCEINALQINFAEEGSTILGRPDSIYQQYIIEYSNNQSDWKKLADKTKNYTDSPHNYVQLPAAVKARYVKITNYHTPSGKFALSGLRVFGKSTGKFAVPVTGFKAVRDSSDKRNVTLTWDKVPGAIGYNIRYGSSPGKLYENYQVLDNSSITIHSLSKLQKYYFIIDVFNENGITKGEDVVMIDE